MVRCRPRRLHGVAIMPVHYRPETTGDYIDKIKGLGLKAMELPSSPRSVFYNSRSNRSAHCGPT